MKVLPVALMLVISASSLIDAAGAKKNIVGTWELEVIERLDDSGKWATQSMGGRLGSQATGYLMYDSAGNFAGQIMRRDRPHFASDIWDDATPEEANSAFQGYVAYFGTYDLNEEESSVTHHRKGSLMPNQVGVDAKRFYKFQGDRLTLTAPSGDIRFTWKRLK